MTSITMNGGTLLRLDASTPATRPLRFASCLDICYFSPRAGRREGRPSLAAFHGLLGHIPYPARRQSPRPFSKAIPYDESPRNSAKKKHQDKATRRQDQRHGQTTRPLKTAHAA